jgi:hypothetical protein
VDAGDATPTTANGATNQISTAATDTAAERILPIIAEP